MNDIQLFVQQHLETIEQIKQLNVQLKSLKEQDANMREGLLQAMQENGIDSFNINGFNAKLVKGSVSISLDTKKLEKEEPGLYDDLLNKYRKETKRKQSVRITIKEDK